MLIRIPMSCRARSVRIAVDSSYITDASLTSISRRRGPSPLSRSAASTVSTKDRPWLSCRWDTLIATRRGGRPALCQERRSEEHTSELQSPCNLVCRLLLEKKKTSEPRRHDGL